MEGSIFTHELSCGMKNAKQSCHKQERTLFNSSQLGFMLVVSSGGKSTEKTYSSKSTITFQKM